MSHFLRALGHVDGGAAVGVADEQLSAVLQSVRQTGKKGTVTVELHVAPNGERGFKVTTKVKAKAPDLDFGESFFFTDRSGHLTRTPPAEESEDLIRLNDRKD